MQYTVAGFNIDVVSEHPSYLFMRLKDYESTFSGEADFTVRCKEEKNIRFVIFLDFLFRGC